MHIIKFALGFSMLWLPRAKKLILLGALFALGMGGYSLYAPDKQDDIRYFFQSAIVDAHYGFVLLGEKPAALLVLVQRPQSLFPLNYWVSYLSPYNQKNNRGWNHFSNNRDMIECGEFLFLAEKNRNVKFITLIHKKRFINQVDKHQSDFVSVLGRSVTGESLLKEVQTKPVLREVLQNHDGLIGILLGYGRENGWKFHDKAQVEPIFDPEITDMYLTYRNKMVWKMFFGRDPVGIYAVAPVSFVGNPQNQETQELMESYHKSAYAILEYYQKKDPLQGTLQLLDRENRLNFTK